MKRFFLLILCILLTLSLAACDKDTTNDPTNDPTEAPTNAPTDAPTEPPTDAPTEPPTDAPTEPPHEHSYTCTETVEASCNANGKKVYTCQCGDQYTEKTPLIDHVFGDWRVSEEPTYTKPGTEKRECTVCSWTERRDIPARTDDVRIAELENYLDYLPIYSSLDELSANKVLEWIFYNVEDYYLTLNFQTSCLEIPCSIDEINRLTNLYFGKTFDFLALLPQREDLSYNEQDNTITWTVRAMDIYPTYYIDDVSKIDDTHYTVRYGYSRNTILEPYEPYVYFILSIEVVDGRFIIRSNARA